MGFSTFRALTFSVVLSSGPGSTIVRLIFLTGQNKIVLLLFHIFYTQIHFPSL